MGHAVDQNLLSLVQQDVKKLLMDYKTTEGSLAQQRVDLTALQKSVTFIQDQQSATGAQLKEHDEQLTAVLEWKEQKMKETREILLKLVSVEKMLSEELSIRVGGVEQSVEGMEQRVEVVEQRVEGMEKGNVERDDKMEQLEQGFAKVEKKVKQLEQTGSIQRMKDNKPG